MRRRAPRWSVTDALHSAGVRRPSAGEVKIDGAGCRGSLRLTVHQKLLGRRIIAVTARRKLRRSGKPVVIRSSTVTISAGRSRKLAVARNRPTQGDDQGAPAASSPPSQ